MSDTDRDDGRYGRGAFDPLTIDDPDTFDATAEDDERSGARGWIVLLAVVAVVAVLAGVTYLAYQQGREEGVRTAPPVVRADAVPEKAAPSDPGGMEIPHQDKEIFKRITGEEDAPDAASGVERLLPPPEEPIAPLAVPSQPVPEEADRAEPGGVSPAGGVDEAAPSGVQEASVPPLPQAGSEPVEQTAPAPVAEPEPQPEAVQSAAAPAPGPAGAGEWVVQVGAFRSSGQATAEWALLQRRHPDLLGSTEPDIQEADLGARGIWFRLRAQGYASEQAAQDACGRLKAAGTDCLVRQR